MPPDITPGTKIAFSGRRGIIVATYPDVRRALIVGQGQDPSLSPDGLRVAFEDSSGSGERHFVVCETRTGRRIASHPGTLPRFSPDGKQICFSRDLQGKWTAWIIDATLKARPRPLAIAATASDPPAFVANWTKDGLIVAYSDTLGGALYVLRPNGSVLHKLVMRKLPGVPETVIPMGCALSDDLSRLLFEGLTKEVVKGASDDGEPLTGLFLYETNTNQVRQVSARGFGATNPVWYDQSTFLFAGAPNRPHSELAIYAQSITGGPARLLVSGASDFAIARVTTT